MSGLSPPAPTGANPSDPFARLFLFLAFSNGDFDRSFGLFLSLSLSLSEASAAPAAVPTAAPATAAPAVARIELYFFYLFGESPGLNAPTAGFAILEGPGEATLPNRAGFVELAGLAALAAATEAEEGAICDCLGFSIVLLLLLFGY